MPRVGFLGAFSIDNTGDVIVGMATRQAVRARVTCEEIVIAVDLPHSLWRHDWSAQLGAAPIRRVDPADPSGHFADDLDALVIGGGGILMPLPGFDAFLAHVRAPSAWNALCSQSTPSFDPTLAPFYASVRAACERLAYVSVRNSTTARLVRRCGWTGALEVVPDPAILFHAEPDPAVDRELARRGDRPLVGLSVGNALLDARAARFYAELLADLERRAAAGEIELVVFPFGRVYGDVELARRAAASMPHARLVGTALDPVATWQLVGKLDLYVCARFHAALAAYTQGVAFLVCDEYLSDTTATSKIRDFIVDRELEASYVVPFLCPRIAARLQLALVDRRPATDALADDRAALERHFDRLVGALALTGP
jgi:polysaccharide pyruvyl transferase WcaK-like protein